jgi:hypothetical protein
MSRAKRVERLIEDYSSTLWIERGVLDRLRFQLRLRHHDRRRLLRHRLRFDDDRL